MNLELNNIQEKELTLITARITEEFDEKDRALFNELVKKVQDTCTKIYNHKVSKLATSTVSVFTKNPKATKILRNTIACGTAPLTFGTVAGSGGSLIGELVQKACETGGDSVSSSVRNTPLIGDIMGDGVDSIFTTIGETFNGITGIIVSVVLFFLLMKPAYSINKMLLNYIGKSVDKLFTSMFDISGVDKKLVELLKRKEVAEFFCASIFYLYKNRKRDKDSLFSHAKSKIKKILNFNKETKISREVKFELYHSNQSAKDNSAALSNYLELAMNCERIDKIKIIEEIKPVLEVIKKMSGQDGMAIHALGQIICAGSAAQNNNLSEMTSTSKNGYRQCRNDTSTHTQTSTKPGIFSGVPSLFGIKSKNVPNKEMKFKKTTTTVSSQNLLFNKSSAIFLSPKRAAPPIPNPAQSHHTSATENFRQISNFFRSKNERKNKIASLVHKYESLDDQSKLSIVNNSKLLHRATVTRSVGR